MLTVTLCGSGSMQAGNETKIVQPKCVVGNVEVTLAAKDGRTFKAGDTAVLMLKAINHSNQPANTTVDLLMTASGPSDAMSRVITIPATVWQKSQVLSLASDETREIELTVPTPLPAGKIISVTLRESNPLKTTPAIVALSFATTTPK